MKNTKDDNLSDFDEKIILAKYEDKFKEPHKRGGEELGGCDFLVQVTKEPMTICNSYEQLNSLTKTLRKKMRNDEKNMDPIKFGVFGHAIKEDVLPNLKIIKEACEGAKSGQPYQYGTAGKIKTVYGTLIIIQEELGIRKRIY